MAELAQITMPKGLVEQAREYADRDPKEMRREIEIQHPDGGLAVVPNAASLQLIRSLVPPRFREATFASFEPATESQKVARIATRTFCDRASKGEPTMLALIGKQGTGKSHLLYAAALALLTRNHRVYARPWYRLADELRYGGKSAFTTEHTHEPAQVREQLWAQPIVLLDEVRPTASTAFDDTELAKFACHAYDANLAVIITTNVNPLSDVMGPAAASRFTQVLIDGPDRRQA
jgi:chromosomal replication initiation ATPase DnaA